MSPIRSRSLRAPLAPKPVLRPSTKRSAPTDGFEGQPSTVALQRGSTGPAVRALQAQLVKTGFLKHADVATGPGVYGPRTEQGVKAFQLSNGLAPTGVAGSATLRALASGTRFVGPSITQPLMARATPSSIESFSEEPTQPIAVPL
jgi:peptidoglycan hydrolase-like protein with peptidoglycan-binding domain